MSSKSTVKKTAKLFMTGRSQAVRLPKEFRMPGTEVRISREGDRIVLEPLPVDFEALWAKIDSYGELPYMEEGREQPAMPPDNADEMFD